MGDMTVGVILMLVTGFLWLAGAILHWHNLKRQERLLGRMRRMTAPRGRGPQRQLARAAARPVAADGFRSGPLTH
jgi:hypothetical protein